jgi:hypothetical protein
MPEVGTSLPAERWRQKPFLQNLQNLQNGVLTSWEGDLPVCETSDKTCETLNFAIGKEDS